MNETYEQEINLKWLCYRILRSWRGIALFAIVLALVVGVASFGLGIVKISDPEYIEDAELSFQREHDSWEAKGANLEAEITNLEASRTQQLEYNEKSVLMQINPLREQVASFELYVDYDYQIMPEMTYQNVDLSDRILKTYETYMANGEMYRYVTSQLVYELDTSFLQEILTAVVDYENHMISVEVHHADAASAREILDLVRAGLEDKHVHIAQSIAEHDLVQTNASAYEAVNLELNATQKANIAYVSELDIKLQEKSVELQNWSKTPEPTPEYTKVEVLKDAIKKLILGGIVGGVLAVGVVAFVCILSGKLLNPDDIRGRFGLRLIGSLPTARVKKPFAFISRWFSAFGGITVRPEDYTGLAHMIGTSIKSELASSPETAAWHQLAFTGTVPQERLEQVVADQELDTAYTAVCAADILTNAASIEKVMKADAVILVEQQEKSNVADIAREIEALRAWNKSVVGVVVIDVDAVM